MNPIRILLVLFAPLWLRVFPAVVLGGEDGEITPEAISALLEKQDFKEIARLAEDNEEKWVKGHSRNYFENMIAMVRALRSYPQSSAESTNLFVKLAEKIVEKNNARDSELGPAMYSSQINTVELLISYDYLNKIPSESDWLLLRSSIVRKIAIVIRRLSDRRILGYKPKTVYMNIHPPINLKNEPMISGMDPRAIKDPTSRKAYEEAIAENVRNNRCNSEQQAIAKFFTYYYEYQIEEFLVKAYARPPSKLEELNEYMLLAGLCEKVRQRILLATQRAPEVGLKDEADDKMEFLPFDLSKNDPLWDEQNLEKEGK